MPRQHKNASPASSSRLMLRRRRRRGIAAGNCACSIASAGHPRRYGMARDRSGVIAGAAREEAKLVGFVDTLELLVAIWISRTTRREDPAGDDDPPDDDDAWPLLDREARSARQAVSFDGVAARFQTRLTGQLWEWAGDANICLSGDPYHFAAGRWDLVTRRGIELTLVAGGHGKVQPAALFEQAVPCPRPNSVVGRPALTAGRSSAPRCCCRRARRG